MHTYIQTCIRPRVFNVDISSSFSVIVVASAKNMLIVYMYGCVSDRMGSRLYIRLLRRGIFGRWRSSWTIPRTRRLSPRYEEAETATYRWNHLRPNLLYSVLHSYIRTCIHTWLFPMFGNIWGRRCLLSFSHPYIQFRMSSCTHMYMHTVYVCLNVCTNYVYVDVYLMT